MLQHLLAGTRLPSTYDEGPARLLLLDLGISILQNAVCRRSPGTRDRRQPVSYGLEVEAQLRRIGARRDIMSAAESGKEIVDRNFIGNVDCGKPQAPFVPVSLKQVVV